MILIMMMIMVMIIITIMMMIMMIHIDCNQCEIDCLIIEISDFHRSIFRELQLLVGAQKVFIFSTHALNDNAGI